jgi:type 1 fimbria pilin
VIFAYGFYNNTPSYNYTVVVFNLGPGQATVTGIVDNQSNIIPASCTIDQGRTCTINITLPSTKPSLVIIKERTSPVTIRAVNY